MLTLVGHSEPQQVVRTQHYLINQKAALIVSARCLARHAELSQGSGDLLRLGLQIICANVSSWSKKTAEFFRAQEKYQIELLAEHRQLPHPISGIGLHYVPWAIHSQLLQQWRQCRIHFQLM